VFWSQDRYEDIVDALKPFLVSAGFASSKTTFLPIAAMDGVNILSSEEPTLSAWYEGTTLIEALGTYAAQLVGASLTNRQTRWKFPTDRTIVLYGYRCQISSKVKQPLHPEWQSRGGYAVE